MTRETRGQDFLAKADRLLTWASTWLDELRSHGGRGDMDAVERTLFAALASITSAHESLASAAACYGRPDFREALNDERQSDPLLRFLWKARDAEVHNHVVKWIPGAHHIQFIGDQRIFQSFPRIYQSPLYPGSFIAGLYYYLFGVGSMAELEKRILVDPQPIPSRVVETGVKITHSLQALVLQDFEVRVGGASERIAAPMKPPPHSNSPLLAHAALEQAIATYRTKVDDLRGLIPDPSSGPP